MSQPDIDFDAIRALASILDETGLSEIEVGEGDRRLAGGRIGTVEDLPYARLSQMTPLRCPQLKML